ncbi:MAG: hypothetical protein QOJ50_214, partial [Cryptosporangiaceae bacterium]|nr:hypothetical protein [Cryptosporangiaceae bacterium]
MGSALSQRAEALTGENGRTGAAIRGWAPAGAVVALLVFLWIQFGVPIGTIARFGVYVVLGLAIPGTLLWRAFGPQLRFRAEEYAAGTAVGYAVEVLARIGASALGVPRLGLAVPLCV